MVVSMNCTQFWNLRFEELSIFILHYKIRNDFTSINYATQHVSAPVVEGEAVDGAVDGASLIIVVVGGIADSHHVVALHHQPFVNVSSEPAMKQPIWRIIKSLLYES